MSLRPKNRRPSPWIAIYVSLVSAIAAVLAVVFAGLAWHGSEEANLIAREAIQIAKGTSQIANRVHIDFEIDPNSDDPQVGFAIRNTGHGTAIIGEMQYMVDGRPAKDLDDALSIAHLDPDANKGYYKIDPTIELTPGETDWVLDYHGKSAAENERLAEFVQHRLTVKVRFCTVTHECSIACYPDKACLALAK